MQKVNIITTQNVFIDYERAGIGERILAALIDFIVIGAYSALTAYILSEMAFYYTWISILFYLPVFFYHLVCEAFLHGQSLGKRVMGVKVVKLDGTPPDIGSYVMRWMLRLVDVDISFGAIAIVSASMTENGQRLGDMAAGTTVVKVKSLGKTDIFDVLSGLEEDYEPVFKEVTKLSDPQMALVMEALEANKEHALRMPAVKATEKVKEIIGVESDMPPVKFLRTVAKDYNYLTSRL